MNIALAHGLPIIGRRIGGGTRMRTGLWLAGMCGALASCLAGDAPAAAPGWSDDDLIAVERCVGFILLGPQYNGIKIHGEGFNCKPLGRITVSSGGTLHVETQISHQLTARPDDQFNISISMLPTGELTEINGKATPGGFRSLGPQFRGNGGDLTTLSGKQLIAAVTANVYFRNWGSTAYAIGTIVALEISRSLRDKSSSPAFLVGRPGHDIARQTELLDGHHYGRNDINSRFPNTYWQACASLCGRTAGCKAWSLARARNPICSLKGPGTEPVLDSEGISGTVGS